MLSIQLGWYSPSWGGGGGGFGGDGQGEAGRHREEGGRGETNLMVAHPHPSAITDRAGEKRGERVEGFGCGPAPCQLRAGSGPARPSSPLPLLRIHILVSLKRSSRSSSFLTT